MAGYYLNAIIILQSWSHKKRSKPSTTLKISSETTLSSNQPSSQAESGPHFPKSMKLSKAKKSSSEPESTMSEEKETIALSSSDKISIPSKPAPSSQKPHPRK